MTRRASKEVTTLRDWLVAEPFLLSLSAGFFGFYAHAGFLRALIGAGLRPTSVRGCSAGALVGGLWASGRTAGDLAQVLMSIDRRDFWDPGLGLGLLKGRLFQEILERELGVATFDETPTPLTVSVFDLRRRQTVSLGEGELAAAIRASCTFPGLFHPVKIGGRSYIDGGVYDRAGHHGLEHRTRVLFHHLSSRSRTRKHVKHTLARTQSNMVTLVCRALPAVSPFHMHRGPEAYQQAYDALSFALEHPIQEDTVTEIGSLG
jgi:NTE family protein